LSLTTGTLIKTRLPLLFSHHRNPDQDATPADPKQPAQELPAPADPKQPAQELPAPADPKQPAQELPASADPKQPAQELPAPADPKQPAQKLPAPAQEQPAPAAVKELTDPSNTEHPFTPLKSADGACENATKKVIGLDAIIWAANAVKVSVPDCPLHMNAYAYHPIGFTTLVASCWLLFHHETGPHMRHF
jgi:hypothetical protein